MTGGDWGGWVLTFVLGGGSGWVGGRLARSLSSGNKRFFVEGGRLVEVAGCDLAGFGCWYS